jgi:hypothetical protein
MGGWHCKDGWLDEANGEPVFSGGEMFTSEQGAQEHQNFLMSQPCTATDGKLATMGNVARCNLVDESVHRVRCKACGKVGWYSERGRLAEEQGCDVFSVIMPK